MECENKESNKPKDRSRAPRRHVSSEEKNWRSYSKSLIVELKEKLAERRARTLGLLSEGADVSAFCEVDTESDGLDDTSSQSHEVKDRLLRDAPEEYEPEVTSLSETSSISDNMDISYHPTDSTDQKQNSMLGINAMPAKQSFFTTTATECHSFSPPRADNTTMTSAKFRFEGDTEFVSVGTECDGLNDSILSTDIPLPQNDISDLGLDNISLDNMALAPKDATNELSNCEMDLNSVSPELDCIEATYSSAVEYFFGTSKERLPCAATSISKSIAGGESLDTKGSDCSNKPAAGSIKEQGKIFPNAVLASMLNGDTSETIFSKEGGVKLTSANNLELIPNDLIPMQLESNAYKANRTENLLSKFSYSEDVLEDESTKASQGAGDFKTNKRSSKSAKIFCHSLIADEILTSELSTTTYTCMVEEMLRIIRSDNKFYSEIDKNTVALLENALHQNQPIAHVDQNVSSNSGNDPQSFIPVQESNGNEPDIDKFQRNQRLQSCLKKARLVSALQLNHQSAATKMGKVVTKQAYDKAVREFEALVTRFATTSVSKDILLSKRLEKHPHVTSLPPFGSNKGNISSKTFIFNNKRKTGNEEESADSWQSKMKRSNTFIMGENRTACKTNEITGNHSMKSTSYSDEKTPLNIDSIPCENKNLSHSESKPNIEKRSLVSQETESTACVDSDSESGESHESGFCSNQIYTSSLLTQLLDYSSQDEDVADLEDVGKSHERTEGHCSKLRTDGEAAEAMALEKAQSLMDFDKEMIVKEHEEKEKGGATDKTSFHINKCSAFKDATFDEDFVTYESDFETGSDSDTNLETLSYRESEESGFRRENICRKDGSSSVNTTKTVPVLSSIKREDETDFVGQDIKSGLKNNPLLINESLDRKYDSDNASPVQNEGHASNNTTPSSLRTPNECNEGKKPFIKQFLSKKNSHSFLTKLDFSSSDDDSTDEIINDLSPAEILRKRQIEQVDVKLEQLKEFAKRKRKARSPHKQRLQNKEKTEYCVDAVNLSDSNQSENRCAYITKESKDFQDYKDPKLLSTCLDLLTRRREASCRGESLHSTPKPNSLYSKEENMDTISFERHGSPLIAISKNEKTCPNLQDVEKQAQAESTFKTKFESDFSASTSNLKNEPLSFEKSVIESEMLTENTHIGPLTQEQDNYLTHCEEIKPEACVGECGNSTRNIEVDLELFIISDDNARKDEQTLTDNIPTSLEFAQDFACITKIAETVNITEDSEVVHPFNVSDTTSVKQTLRETVTESSDIFKNSFKETDLASEKPPASVTYGMNDTHYNTDDSLELSKRLSDEAASIPLVTVFQNDEDKGNNLTGELSVQHEDETVNENKFTCHLGSTTKGSETVDTTTTREVIHSFNFGETTPAKQLDSGAVCDDKNTFEDSVKDTDTTSANIPTSVSYGKNDMLYNTDESLELSEMLSHKAISIPLVTVFQNDEGITSKLATEMSINHDAETIDKTEKITNHLENASKNEQNCPAGSVNSDNHRREGDNESVNLACTNFSNTDFSETSVVDKDGHQSNVRCDETLLTSSSNLLWKVNDTKCPTDIGVKDAWQVIGTVNDFYKFLFESKMSESSNRPRYLYSVCNPDYLHPSGFQQLGNRSHSQLSPPITNTLMPEGCQSLQNDNEYNHANSLMDDEADSVDEDEVCKEKSSPRHTLFQDSKHDVSFQIITKLQVLENLFSQCAHSQEMVKYDMKEMLRRQDMIAPDQTKTKAQQNCPNSFSQTCEVAAQQKTRDADFCRTPKQSLLQGCHELKHSATQTPTSVTQACQTEDLTMYAENSLSLKHSLQTSIEENFIRFQGELETIKSEVKVLGNERALSVSRFEELAQMMRGSKEDMIKTSQDFQYHMKNNFECFKDAISSSLGASMKSMKETFAEEMKSQSREMLQTLKADLESSLDHTHQEVQMKLNAVKRSLESQTKIKETVETSVERKSPEGELQNSQPKKGVDVETMKMRIVELTSQRDAEKVFHKITRQSLRALERDHERLREEFLGARLRRDRKLSET
ncbi:hypothetical protein ElyMa_004417900 [Elysia marginata]|uniref:Uncharacterized protein n=1 Tax=Elysia marginata TaxID=1093978 RepID=A0AAV4HBC1_9GAST|nr:hypothetical protein ElyMa_004417900 [Elysia marginata]